MLLESKITIFRTPEQVWSFLGDISNIPKWDRGVASAMATSTNPSGAEGFEFDTFAPAGMVDGGDRGRMSYRIAEIGPDHCAIRLTSSTGNARFFERAEWRFRIAPATAGTLLTCSADFAFRFRYIILAPIFYALRSAIRRDLSNLKRVLEDSSLG